MIINRVYKKQIYKKYQTFCNEFLKLFTKAIKLQSSLTTLFRLQKQKSETKILPSDVETQEKYVLIDLVLEDKG